MSTFSIALDQIPLGVEWSYLQDEILTVWFDNGEVRYYNYRECSLVMSLKLDDTIQSLFAAIKG